MNQHVQLLRLLTIHKIDASLSLVLSVLQADVDEYSRAMLGKQLGKGFQAVWFLTGSLIPSTPPIALLLIILRVRTRTKKRQGESMI